MIAAAAGLVRRRSARRHSRRLPGSRTAGRAPPRPLAAVRRPPGAA